MYIIFLNNQKKIYTFVKTVYIQMDAYDKNHILIIIKMILHQDVMYPLMRYDP